MKEKTNKQRASAIDLSASAASMNGKAMRKLRTKSVQRKYAARYMQMLEAATLAFSNKGYHVATTKDIADLLGIQQGSLYYYIKSKEVALEQVCLLAIEGYVAFSDEIRSSDSSTADKIHKLISHHLATVEERPALFNVFMRHRHELRDEVRHELGRQIRKYEKNVEAIVRQGIRKAEFRSNIDPKLATLALLGMCNFVGTWWGKRSVESIPRICANFADVFIEGLAASPAQKRSPKSRTKLRP